MSPGPRSPDVRTPPGFERWPAADKHDWIWTTLILGSAHDPGALPPLETPFRRRPLAAARTVLGTERLRVSLDSTSDVMPPARPKVIHARGSVAMIRFETDDESPFTGLLGPPPAGGATGLLRLSLVARVTRTASITPGLGLKLLVDGRPSADLLAMNHTVGQGRDFDLFSNTMTHDHTEEHRELRAPQRLVSRLFSRVVDEPRRLTIDHLAAVHRDGTAVDVPARPRRIVLHPTDAARRVFAGGHQIDFRRVLADIAPDTAIYDVVGLVGPPGSSDRRRIGRIVTATRFVSSEGGDRLFFRHVVG